VALRPRLAAGLPFRGHRTLLQLLLECIPQMGDIFVEQMGYVLTSGV
jgi:hypothetical protein